MHDTGSTPHLVPLREPTFPSHSCVFAVNVISAEVGCDAVANRPLRNRGANGYDLPREVGTGDKILCEPRITIQRVRPHGAEHSYYPALYCPFAIAMSRYCEF